MKILVLLYALACPFPGALALPQRDLTFSSFLERFIADEQFRFSRITLPLPAKVGNEYLNKVRVERWTKQQVKENLIAILPRTELSRRGLKQLVRRYSAKRVEIFQYRPEADSYLITYRFENIGGKWYLTFFEDASM